MKIVRCTQLDSAEIGRFYALYQAAFEPMRTRAAARHLLTIDEFAAEMADERIEKYVANGDAAAVGLTTMTTHLAAIPWIEPLFYLSRYPQQAARGALFYLGYILVDPRAEDTYGAFKAMADSVLRRCADSDGVLAWDACVFNVERAIGRMTGRLETEWKARVEEVDRQAYFVAHFGYADPREAG